MCKLCNTDRKIMRNYEGVYLNELKIVNDYLGENCCSVCIYNICKNGISDIFIIRKLYKAYSLKEDRREHYNDEYRKNNKDAIQIGRDKWANENKEKIRVGQEKYREENKEKIKLGMIKWRSENKEKIRVGRKKYREENKEKIKLGMIKWRSENKEKNRDKVNKQERERYHKRKLQKETA